MNEKGNQIQNTVLEALTEHLPDNSVLRDDIEEQTYEAIERTIILTAQMIFAEIEKERRMVSGTPLGKGIKAILLQKDQLPRGTGVVLSEDLIRIEDAWLKDACDFCGRRKSSVIKRKDGSRVCAKCETEE